jgi:GLPGLI family protein
VSFLIIHPQLPKGVVQHYSKMKIFRYLFALSLFCILSSITNAQSLSIIQGIEVEYLATVGDQEMYDKTDNCQLFAKGGVSMYIIAKDFDNGQKKVQQTTSVTGQVTFNVRAKSKVAKQFYIDRLSGELTARLPMFDEVFLVKESIPDFDWQLTSETKDVAGYTCSMAIGNHRGRTFKAWFTSEVPMNAGPWKFSGLPGLILEVNDEEGDYNWYCKSIKPLGQEGAAAIVAPQAKNEVTHREYFELAESKIKERFEKLAANPNITVTGNFSMTNGLERTKE